MATSSQSPIQYLRRIAMLPSGAGLTDEQLLDLYIDRQDHIAFEMLVRRHGPMVLGVCRRLLHNPADAEDAFQATFLILVRKAHKVVPRSMVGNWLYGVASKAAMKARAASLRRRKKEKQVPDFPDPPAPATDDRWRDLKPLLDRELGRLAEKYRAPIILCDIERKTHKEAAKQLGWPEGTLSVRLMRARKMLAKRLTGQGLSLSAAPLAVLLSENAASAKVPTTLIGAIVQAASTVAAGQAVAAGVISSSVPALTQGVLKAMVMTKIKVAAAVLLLVGLTAFGGSVIALRFAGAEQNVANKKAEAPPIFPQDLPRKDAAPPKQVKTPLLPKSDAEKLRGTWRVVSETTGGRESTPKDTKWIIGKESIMMSKALMSIGEPSSGRQEASYRLWGDNEDAAPVPNAINMTLVHANSSKDGERAVEQLQTLRGIFAWDGDKLKLCFGFGLGLGVSFGESRPTTIPIAPITDKTLMVLVLEREESPSLLSDEERLQGEWALVDLVTDGVHEDESKITAQLKWLGVDKFTFDGTTMGFPMVGQLMNSMYFKLDPTKSPKEIVVRMTGTFVTVKGQRTEVESKGIYALDGDDLKLCIGGQGGAAAERTVPEDFVSKPGSGHNLFVLKRYRAEEDSPLAVHQSSLASKVLGKDVFKVGEIVIVGNDKIPSGPILRQIGLKPGQVFDEQSLKLAEKNLAVCPFFVVDTQKGIRPTVTAVERNGGDEFRDILVTVKEAQ